MAASSVRVIAAGVGAPMAVQGNVIGLILYLLLNLLPSTLVRYFGFKIGYQGGREFLAKISADGTLTKATEAAKILGLTVIGGLVRTIVKFPITLELDMQGVLLNFQEILDTIMPGLLPLILSFVVFGQLRKGRSPNTILLVLLVGGMLLFFGMHYLQLAVAGG